MLRASARFLLAQALWESGGAHARALALATEARGLVDDAAPEGARLRNDVEDWLARHGGKRMKPD